MIRLAVVDDESLVASSLSTLLSLEEDLDVVFTAGSGEEIVVWWEKQQQQGQMVADVCVVDLHLRGIDGIDTAAKLRRLTPNLATMIVTSHARPRGLKRALEQGVLGFLPKTSTAEEFSAAIRAVNRGKRFIDPELAAATISAGDSPLTPREEEVLEAAGHGGSIEEISDLVHLAAGTTRNYLSSAMSKVGAQNRFEAFNRARDKGWI